MSVEDRGTLSKKTLVRISTHPYTRILRFRFPLGLTAGWQDIYRGGPTGILKY